MAVTPLSIELPSIAHRIEFSPQEGYILAAACVDGTLALYSVTDSVSSSSELLKVSPMAGASDESSYAASSTSYSAIRARAKKSIRGMAFSPSGESVVLGFASGALMEYDLNSGGCPVWVVDDATSPALSRRWRADPKGAATKARSGFAPAKSDGDAVASLLASLGGGKGKGKGKGKGRAMAYGEDDEDDEDDEVVAINSVVSLGGSSGSAYAVGDDFGTIRIWDVRAPTFVRSIHMHEDYVTEMTVTPNGNTLISVAGDGRVGAFSLSQNKPIAQSESLENDLVGVGTLRSGTRAVVAAQHGEICVFSDGMFGAPSDKWMAQSSIEAMVPISEMAVATAASDGTVRILSIQPNHLIEIVSEHEVEVLDLACSRDQVLLASTGHDGLVKFTNLMGAHDRVCAFYSGEEGIPRTKDIISSHTRNSAADADFFDGL